jgi:DNA-binding PadR family transcriptional regulator
MPTLAYAILALLAREPLTGYEVSAQLRDPIGHFWQARHSQVYPVLARLDRLGWAAAEIRPGRGPRPTKRYRPTDAGLDALRTWVASRSGRRTTRDELLLRVYASWVVDRAVAIRVLRDAEAAHVEQLRIYLERRVAGEARHPDEQAGSAWFADYATLRRGIGFERGRLAWIRWLIGRLEGGD